MDIISQIKYSRLLERNKYKLLKDSRLTEKAKFKFETALVETEREIFELQDNCSHIGVYLGNDENNDKIVRCVLCCKKLKESEFSELEDKHLIIDAHDYSCDRFNNHNGIQDYMIKFDVIQVATLRVGMNMEEPNYDKIVSTINTSIQNINNASISRSDDSDNIYPSKK